MSKSPAHRSGLPGASGLLRALAMTVGLGLALSAASAQPPPGRPTGPRLTDFWERWGADLAPLMSEAESEEYYTLSSHTRRESFARAFWQARGDEAAERWGRNREDVRRLGIDSPARRAVLLFGRPSRSEAFPRCGGLRRIEAWSWDRAALASQGATEPTVAATLIFVRSTSFDKRSLAAWAPGDLDGLTYAPRSQSDLDAALDYAASSPCFEQERIERLRELLGEAVSFDDLRRQLPWPDPDDGWLEEWRQAEDEDWPGARLEVDFPGGFNDQTIVGGRLLVRTDRLHGLAPGRLFDRVTITGDVHRDSYLADSFQIVHHVAGYHSGPEVALDFHRRLRPGAYTLDLRAVDRYGRPLLAVRSPLEVPAASAPAAEPAGRALGYSHLTRPDVIAVTTFPGVELLAASAQGGGRLQLHAATTGGPIDAVEFYLDGVVVQRDDDPPYSLTIDSAKIRRLAKVVAMDPEGRPLAVSERWLEPEDRGFHVRFGDLATDHAPVTLSLPLGAALERLECLHGRRQTATLTTPPWRCPLPERFSPRADYLTARATLAGGETAEAVLFLSPGVEQVDVRLAELYLTVVDEAGHRVGDLGAADFRLLDGRGELPLESAESLANLPLNVSLLMDVSSSMGRDVRLVAASAQRFFEEVLEPGDLAALGAFNHDLHHLSRFTGDPDELRHASAGLRAGGSTRLHDAIVHALFQFAGLDDRRALIVLSDGEDVGSDFPFEQVLDEAIRAGVAVYPIFLGSADEATSEDLQRLAARTGGRWFAVDGASELDGALRGIAAELRAQYLLVFRPREGRHDLAFRQLRVELDRPGLAAQDVHGHYR